MSYNELVNIEDFEKKENFILDRGGVGFYCKDCRKIVDTKRPKPNGYIFICNECMGKNISIGTNQGLKNNYKIK